jgi:hypothetical protein
MRSGLANTLLLGAALAVFSVGCVTTQGKVILGAVMDNNNRPISGAMVTTDPPTSSVATDNLGRYLLRLEKEGTYSVRADMLGYVCEPITVRVKGKDITQADIKLLPEGMVPVSKTAKPIPVVKEPAPTPKETPAPTPKPAKKKKWWEN